MKNVEKQLNWKEERIVELLLSCGEPLTLKQLRRKAFPGVRPITKADSQVRNSLRKPRKLRLIKRVEAGKYAVV